MSGQAKAIAGVLLVFLLGCAAGTLASSAFFIHRGAVFLQRGAPAYVDILERRLTRGLSLDATQKTQIHDAFMSNLEERKKLQLQIQPQVRDLNQQTFRQIKTILHPDQVEGFQKNLAELHRRLGRLGAATEGTEEGASAPSNAEVTTPAADKPATNP